jgi:NAD(P)-dependent dehydrogenase (short-subunit alcohol dehydrogenase family)
MAQPFFDQVAWITGGGTGLGRFLALELARQGAHVAVSGRRQDKLDEVVAAVQALGRRALAIPLDVTDAAAQQAAVARIEAELGRLDVAVANAGFGVGGDLETIALPAFERQFRVNVFALLGTVQAALPALRRSGGRLGLVGSVAHTAFAPGYGAYNASKAAVHALGETLAAELSGSGVSVTLLHPGFVESEIYTVDNDNRPREGRRDHRPRQLMWPTDRAARSMARALRRRKRVHVFTGHSSRKGRRRRRIGCSGSGGQG